MQRLSEFLRGSKTLYEQPSLYLAVGEYTSLLELLGNNYSIRCFSIQSKRTIIIFTSGIFKCCMLCVAWDLNNVA